MEHQGDSDQSYLCIPHHDSLDLALEKWKGSQRPKRMYFVTATFTEETRLYFPGRANHYILISNLGLQDKENTTEIISTQERHVFEFKITTTLFERLCERLNYVSIYFMRYSYGQKELIDLATSLAKRDRVTKAALAEMTVSCAMKPKFSFPYSRNLLILEVDGGGTHQSDQRYCERTRRDAIRKGMSLSNLFSFSILEQFE
ncbi:MAG: hypothetical protein ACRD8Z_18335 [Nitrososphaeraceae archaeon]